MTSGLVAPGLVAVSEGVTLFCSCFMLIFMDEDQKKHLELIQTVISRMTGNSFLIRGWSVTLVSALFALAAKDANGAFAVISYFPCVLFWCLDAYYLSQERKFRSLYNSVRMATSTDFSMSTELTATTRDSWASAFFSTTILFFHLGIVGVVSVVMWVLTK